MIPRIGDLQTAHITQTDYENQPTSEWIVYNDKREEIFRLPASMTPREAMAVIHFARDYELKAFNAGVNFQKDKTPEELKTLRKMLINLESDKVVMKKRNIELANELEKLNNQLDKLTIKN